MYRNTNDMIKYFIFREKNITIQELNIINQRNALKLCTSI